MKSELGWPSRRNVNVLGLEDSGSQSLMINSFVSFASQHSVLGRGSTLPSISLQKFCRCFCLKIPFQFNNRAGREKGGERGRETMCIIALSFSFVCFFLNKKSFNLVIWGKIRLRVYLHF